MNPVVLVQDQMALLHQIILGHLIKEETFHLFKMGKGMLHTVFWCNCIDLYPLSPIRLPSCAETSYSANLGKASYIWVSSMMLLFIQMWNFMQLLAAFADTPVLSVWF